MSIDNFIPQVWADKIIDRWEDRSPLSALFTANYVGTVAAGNTVHLVGVVSPTITNYKSAGRKITPEDLGDIGVDLTIDQEKAFAFKVDDVDAAQAMDMFGAYTDAAADGLVTDTNRFIAAMLATGGTALAGTAPTTGNDAFDLIVQARKALGKAEVPADNRVLLVNSDFEGLLLGADSKLTGYDTSGDATGLRLATVGTLLGFRVVTSNSVPGDGPAFIALHTDAAAFVSQLSKVESVRAHDSLADVVRGVHVYGGVVIKPEGIQVFGVQSDDGGQG